MIIFIPDNLNDSHRPFTPQLNLFSPLSRKYTSTTMLHRIFILFYYLVISFLYIRSWLKKHLLTWNEFF